MDVRSVYEAILELQADLRFEVQAYTELSDASMEIRALAATYEIQEYLENQIGTAVAEGKVEEEE